MSRGSRRWPAVLLCLALAALFCGTALANDAVASAGAPECSIAGAVRTGHGRPFGGAIVTAYDASGGVAATAISDGQGSYLLAPLPLGSYRVGFVPSSSYSSTLYLPQFFDRAVTLADATPIVLTDSAPAFAGADGVMDEAGYRAETLARDDGSWRPAQLLRCRGTTVAVSGDMAVVGAPSESRNGVNACGAAYICVRDASGWRTHQAIDTPAPVPYGYFGRAVAMDGDTLIISQYTSEAWNDEPGRAFIYVRRGSTWRLQAELTASGDAGARRAFGEAVALQGDTAAVGAPFARIGGDAEAGAVYVFRRTGETWTQRQRLTAGQASAPMTLFGDAVAMDDRTMVVGAPSEDTKVGRDAGAAHVFSLAGTVWEARARLLAADARFGDAFGSPLALSGDTLIVSALNKTTWGEVQVFVRGGAGWKVQSVLDRPEGAGDFFGSALAVSGDAAMVGWPLLEREGSGDSGAALYYLRKGAEWHRVFAIGDREQAGQRGVGSSLGIVGRDLLVFCRRERATDGGDSFAVRVYRPYVAEAGAELDVAARDGILANDTPPNGQTATAQLVAAPLHGSIVLGSDGSFSYIPASGFVGTDTFQYRVTSESWSSSPATVTVSVQDLAAPTVGVDGVTAGWVNTPVTIELSAADATAVKRIDYRRAASALWQRYTSPIRIRADGVRAYRVRASDTLGNVRSGAGFTVRIDKRRPAVRAPYPARCSQSGRLTLRFEVRDPRPGAPTADVTIDIYRGRDHRGTLHFDRQRVNRVLTVRSACWLKPGTYRFVVTATDAAGNRQRSAASNSLVVK